MVAYPNVRIKLRNTEICAAMELREGLAASLKDVAREERELEQTQVKKHAAIGEYDEAFSSVASMLTTFLEVAGERKLASRVRPSKRRPGQTAEEAGDDKGAKDENSEEDPTK